MILGFESSYVLCNQYVHSTRALLCIRHLSPAWKLILRRKLFLLMPIHLTPSTDAFSVSELFNILRLGSAVPCQIEGVYLHSNGVKTFMFFYPLAWAYCQSIYCLRRERTWHALQGWNVGPIFMSSQPLYQSMINQSLRGYEYRFCSDFAKRAEHVAKHWRHYGYNSLPKEYINFILWCLIVDSRPEEMSTILSQTGRTLGELYIDNTGGKEFIPLGISKAKVSNLFRSATTGHKYSKGCW